MRDWGGARGRRLARREFRPERRPCSALRPGRWARGMTRSARGRAPRRDGDYDRHALDAYSHLLRDRRNGEVEPIFYGVLDQLFFLCAQQTGADPRLGLPLGRDERVAQRHHRGRRPQLAAHDRHGGGYQGARPCHRGCVASGGRSAPGADPQPVDRREARGSTTSCRLLARRRLRPSCAGRLQPPGSGEEKATGDSSSNAG